MNSNPEKTLNMRNQWQIKHQRSTTDSPDSDFAQSVRESLIRMGMFKPVPTEVAETPTGRLTPLTPTDWSSDRSSTTPSKFA